jgi:hypothetical protein
MTDKIQHKILNYFIAAVWIVNGLFCKVFNLVPRHQQIVAAILGGVDSRELTVVIGFLEIGMALWILSGMKPRFNAVSQIVIIATMNALEFAVVPHLLLWGRFNAIFAFMLTLLIYYNEFYSKSIRQQP